MTRSAEMSDSTLTELQRQVLEVFFALPESDGFVLAGGAALVASGLTERPTQDVDLFGSDVATGIAAAADALEAACADRGWTTNLGRFKGNRLDFRAAGTRTRRPRRRDVRAAR